jgi:hypothetical protein
MAWVNGPTGATGIQGPQGLQGKQGPYGPSIGQTGQPWTTIPTVYLLTPTTSTIYLEPITTLYNLYGIGPNITVNLPNYAVFPVPENTGVFWAFRNNTASTVTLTFTGDYTNTVSLIVGQRCQLISSVDTGYNDSYIFYTY